MSGCETKFERLTIVVLMLIGWDEKGNEYFLTLMAA
jgi:hypothetical protein